MQSMIQKSLKRIDEEREEEMRSTLANKHVQMGRGRLKQLQGHQSSQGLVLYVSNSCLGAVMSMGQLTGIHESQFMFN